MGRRAAPEPEPETTQADPTAARPMDAMGHELDRWGLPLSGPVRVARLAELGKPDPNGDPDAWADDEVAPPAEPAEPPAPPADAAADTDASGDA